MRITVVTALLAGVVLAGGGCTSSKPESSPTHRPGRTGVAVKITPSKPEYARGEQIVLSIELTNTEAKACRVSRVPEGAVTFVSLTRDGNAVVPVLSTSTYINGFTSFLTANVVQVAHGASVTVLMKSDQNAAAGDREELETSTLDALDEAVLAFWPVDQPGRYTLSARYVLPALPHAPADVCSASGDPARTEFTVVGGGR